MGQEARHGLGQLGGVDRQHEHVHARKCGEGGVVPSGIVAGNEQHRQPVPAVAQVADHPERLGVGTDVEHERIDVFRAAAHQPRVDLSDPDLHHLVVGRAQPHCHEGVARDERESRHSYRESNES